MTAIKQQDVCQWHLLLFLLLFLLLLELGLSRLGALCNDSFTLMDRQVAYLPVAYRAFALFKPFAVCVALPAEAEAPASLRHLHCHTIWVGICCAARLLSQYIPSP